MDILTSDPDKQTSRYIMHVISVCIATLSKSIFTQFSSSLSDIFVFMN
jgi:hypothetical protein